MFQYRRIVERKYPSASDGSSRKVLEDRFKAIDYRRKMQDSLFWGCINTVLLSFSLTNLPNCCGYSYPICGLMVISTPFFFFNGVFHIIRYYLNKSKMAKLYKKPHVKKVSEVQTTELILAGTPNWISYQKHAFLDIKENKDEDKQDGDEENTSKVVMFNGYEPKEVVTPESVCKYKHRCSVIENIKDLETYLEAYEEAERDVTVGNSFEATPEMSNDFWGYATNLFPLEVSPLLKTSQYQNSSPFSSDAGHNTSDDGGSPILDMYCDIWRRNKITPAHLIMWLTNLRMWLSRTILQRIAAEVDNVNKALKTQGLGSVVIGHSGLDTLMSIANQDSVVMHIPTLIFLIPFLKVSSNQEYVVRRIKELAVGNSMSEYDWKSGGKIDGRNWESHLPCDSELIMHLFCTYMDSQLPLLPTDPYSQPFTHHYFAKAPHKPKNSGLSIVQQVYYPPNYDVFVKGGKQRIPSGHNNLFYSILFFLFEVKTNHQGRLGRVSLGNRGLNMMWILEDV